MAVSTSIRARYDVPALRVQEFPITQNTVFLNHAAISPLPRRTYAAIQAANERLMLDPSNFHWFEECSQAFSEAFRQLINAASPEEIAPVQSTSLGINLAAHALPWERGQNIVLCDIEFPSNVYPWMSLQEHHGVEVRLTPPRQGGLSVDSVAERVDAKTRLVAVSAIQFFTGHRADLAALGAFCRERGILFAVDAIQAAGHMAIDVHAMNIAILVSGGQKSLMGPAGQGFMYVRGDVAEQMRPALVSANSVDDWQHWLQYKLTPRAGAARFLMGTPNVSGIAGLTESVALLRGLGIPAIDSYVTALADYAIERLRAAGYDVITPAAHGPIVTFRAAETEDQTKALAEALAARRIFIAMHLDPKNVAHVRASLHCYNTTQDIDRFLEALAELKQGS